VSVPVLSKATVLALETASINLPPFIRTPFLDAEPIPE